MRRNDLFKLFLAGMAIGYCAVANAQDPSGFTERLNGVRQSVGLPLVSCDSGIVWVARDNNSAQRVYGLGHHVTGGLAQCAAIGCGDTAGALSAWLNSPAHRNIILSPALTAVGYASDGWAATAACSMATNSAPVELTAQARVQPAGALYCQPRRRLFSRIFHSR